MLMMLLLLLMLMLTNSRSDHQGRRRMSTIRARVTIITRHELHDRRHNRAPTCWVHTSRKLRPHCHCRGNQDAAVISAGGAKGGEGLRVESLSEEGTFVR